MTKKKILITVTLLLAAAGMAFALRKTKAGKKLSGILQIGDTQPTEGDGDVIGKGSGNEQRVQQLQEAINAIHKAAIYINNNCGGIKWAVFPGGLLSANGVFDDKTEKAVQFYFGGRKNVDLWYLDMIRQKITAYEKGDKCVYPMAIPG